MDFIKQKQSLFSESLGKATSPHPEKSVCIMARCKLMSTISDMLDELKQSHFKPRFLLNKYIRDLISELKNEGREIELTRKELVMWAIMEILETDVDNEELTTWLKHKNTLNEIIMDERDGMIALIRRGQAQARIARLKLRHL